MRLPSGQRPITFGLDVDLTVVRLLDDDDLVDLLLEFEVLGFHEILANLKQFQIKFHFRNKKLVTVKWKSKIFHG